MAKKKDPEVTATEIVKEPTPAAFKSLAEVDAYGQSTSGVALVKFGAKWCGPCRMLDVNLKRMLESGAITAAQSVDVDECPEVLMELQVTSVPYTRMYVNGEYVISFQGVVSEAAIKDAIDADIETKKAKAEAEESK